MDKKKTNKKKLSTLIKQQVPEFVLSDHPKFTEFLTSYFLFMESAELNLDTFTAIDQILLETVGVSDSFVLLNQTTKNGLDAGNKLVDEENTFGGSFQKGEVITGSVSGATSTVLAEDVIVNSRLFISANNGWITGETVTGSISGFSGQLTKKNVDLNQLVIQNVNSKAPLGDPEAISGGTELLIGQTSGDSVGTYQAYKYSEAPHHYYITGDKEKRQVTNAQFIQGGEPSSNLSFQTNRSYVNELNEERSRIRVVDPAYIDRFADEFEKILNV